MNKYILASKSERSGKIGDDYTRGFNPNEYLELGHELNMTYLQVKKLYMKGLIDDSDTIVTKSGREFLYTSVFKKVISYENFKKLNIESSKIIDLIPNSRKLLNENFIMINNYPIEYKYYDVYKDIMTDVEFCDVKNIHENKKYVIICIRKRDHDNKRNMSDELANYILNNLVDKYEKIFIFGQSIENFENLPQIKCINLQEYASLSNNELCDFILCSISGNIQISSLFSKTKLVITLDLCGTHLEDLKILYKPNEYSNIIKKTFGPWYSDAEFVYVERNNIQNFLNNFFENL